MIKLGHSRDDKEAFLIECEFELSVAWGREGVISWTGLKQAFLAD